MPINMHSLDRRNAGTMAQICGMAANHLEQMDADRGITGEVVKHGAMFQLAAAQDDGTLCWNTAQSLACTLQQHEKASPGGVLSPILAALEGGLHKVSDLLDQRTFARQAA